MRTTPLSPSLSTSTQVIESKKPISEYLRNIIDKIVNFFQTIYHSIIKSLSPSEGSSKPTLSATNITVLKTNQVDDINDTASVDSIKESEVVVEDAPLQSPILQPIDDLAVSAFSKLTYKQFPDFKEAQLIESAKKILGRVLNIKPNKITSEQVFNNLHLVIAYSEKH